MILGIKNGIVHWGSKSYDVVMPSTGCTLKLSQELLPAFPIPLRPFATCPLGVYYSSEALQYLSQPIAIVKPDVQNIIAVLLVGFLPAKAPTTSVIGIISERKHLEVRDPR